MNAFALAFPIPLWPRSASAAARGVDELFLFELSISAVTTLAIFGTIAVFAMLYRRRSPGERPRPLRGNLWVEAIWSIGPFFVFLIFFFWGAKIYFDNASPPSDSMQLYVVGKQWMWHIQHPEGQREINEVHVPVGRNVQFIMTSQDVIHSFYMPEFRIKKDVLPGMYTTEWFHATSPGTYHLFCAEYCGTNHSHMIGTVYVMRQSDYQQWLSAGGRGETMAMAGGRLYQRLGCVNCHGVIAPVLNGLYQKGVGLADGRVVRADDAYIRESILDPGAKIVAGFPNLMPSFQGLVTEEGILDLIAYIKSLGAPASAGPGAGIGAGQGSGAAAGIAAPTAEQQQGVEHGNPPAANPHAIQSERSSEIQRRVGGEVRDRE